MQVNPPLHADLFVYKLDESFASGSSIFHAGSASTDWDALVLSNIQEVLAEQGLMRARHHPNRRRGP